MEMDFHMSDIFIVASSQISSTSIIRYLEFPQGLRPESMKTAKKQLLKQKKQEWVWWTILI